MEQKLRIKSGLAISTAELHFRFSRGGGPGGQNVNKVSSRVELLFHVNDSPSLTLSQKARITGRLQSRIGADGYLTLSSQESRSQWQNREHVIHKFIALLSKALQEVRPRIATKATKASRERRLTGKTHEARKKERRRRPDPE